MSSGPSVHQLTQFLLVCHQALCRPWTTALLFHGSIPCFLLGTLWFLSGWIRLKGLDRIRKARRLEQPIATSGEYKTQQRRRSLRLQKLVVEESPSSSNKSPLLPWVTVLLPTRGYRPRSIANWEAILKLDYTGHVEFLFLLENEADSATAVVHKLAHCIDTYGQNREARVVYAGHASTSSQKIQNLIAGVAAADHRAAYIVCLDDDVQVHFDLLSSLIRDMEAAPDLLVATGYPFDVPAAAGHAGLLSYAALAYHLPLVIAFSISERTQFVWGGCMLFRAGALRNDSLGFLSAWAHGGYSDDLTVAARCTQLGLRVFCPSYAIFPQFLDADYSMNRYWNYLRRQLVVLDTYASDHNRRTNHVMAVLHCYFSWAFVLPIVLVCAKIVVHIVALLAIHLVTNNNNNSSFVLPSESRLHFSSMVVFMGLFTYTAVALWWMTGVVCSVLEELNPDLVREMSANKESLKGQQQQQQQRLASTFNWGKLWVGFIFANAVLPVCMVYTFATRHITWAGVRYQRRKGKVVSAEHS